LRDNEKGAATADFTITAEGTVTGITISKSSGYRDLDQATVRCVSHWKYRPAMKDGVPVPALWRATVNWSVDDWDLRAFYVASYDCVQNPPPDSRELAKAINPTVVQIKLSNGAITAVVIQSSSGSETLDARAAACVVGVSTELTKRIENQPLLAVPIVWKWD
jgi:TonB family protein